MQNGVTSVLITEHHKPIGVINDRELLREIVEERKDPNKTLAKDLRYTPLIIMDRGESIIDAMRLMREKGMKRIAMVKNGQLVGMLTENNVKEKTPIQVQNPAA